MYFLSILFIYLSSLFSLSILPYISIYPSLFPFSFSQSISFSQIIDEALKEEVIIPDDEEEEEEETQETKIGNTILHT